MKVRTKFGCVLILIIAVAMLFCACSIKQTEPVENINPTSVPNVTDSTNNSTSNEDTSTAEVENINDTESTQIIEEFLNAIKDKDVEGLKQIISPSGLVVIRNFSSGNGARGKDIRGLYLANEIPSNLQFEVSGEVPVDLHELFKGSQQADVTKIPVEKVTDTNFNFLDSSKNDIYGPATDEVRDICGEVIGSEDDNSQYKPKLFSLGDKEIALTESALEADAPFGEWAVFEMLDGRFYLRAIIDLR